MALNLTNKINNKLKFLKYKNDFLTPAMRRLLCNALVQPHFDDDCSASKSNKEIKSKLLTTSVYVLVRS